MKAKAYMKKTVYMKKTALTFLLALSLFASETGRCMAAEQDSAEKQGGVETQSGVEKQGVDTAEKEAAVQGTEAADEIQISNAQDLERFAQECRNDWYSYGKVFSLTADIDLTGMDFQGIPYFNGTLKGNGHTISGFSLSRKGSDYGFFRYLGKNAVVGDLIVEGTVRMDGSAENVGGLAGMNFGTLSGCSFHGTVTASKSVGGVVGYNKADGKVVECSASGTVTATNGTGGICGENKGVLKDCVSECVVNGEDLKPTLDLDGVDLGSLNLTQNVVTRNDSGGIAGITSGTITGCINRGPVGYAHVGYNVGGIAGRQSGTIIACENEGEILGRKDVGGIVGQAEPYMESEYLSDRLEKLQDDLGTMNRLVVQMSDALSQTSSDASEYTKALQKQYEDTIDSLNREVNSLRDTISEDHQETRNYIDSISSALDNIGNLGNDTVKRMVDGVRNDINHAMDTVNGVVDDVKNEIDKIKPVIPDKGEDGKGDTEPTETPSEDESEGGEDKNHSGDSGENGSDGNGGSGSQDGGSGSSSGGGESADGGSTGSGTEDGSTGGSGSGGSGGSEGNGSSGSSSGTEGGSTEGGSTEGSSGTGSNSGNGSSDGSSSYSGASGRTDNSGNGGSGKEDRGKTEDAQVQGSNSARALVQKRQLDTAVYGVRAPMGRNQARELMAAGEEGAFISCTAIGGTGDGESDASLNGGSGSGGKEADGGGNGAGGNSTSDGGNSANGKNENSGSDAGDNSDENPGDEGGNITDGKDGNKDGIKDEIKDEIKDQIDDIKDKADKKKGELKKPEPDPEIESNLNKMKDEISSISGNMKNMQNTISSTGDSVSDAAGNISNELNDQSKLSGDTIDSLTDSIDGGIQSLTGSMKGLMNTQQRITDSMNEDLNILMGNGDSLLDISSGNVTEKTLGVIYGCTNNGSVDADINPGGIAGTMNVEYDFDPELDLDLSKLTDVAVRSTTNDVVIHCINYGKINAKKNNCGGIAGSEELGLIYDCENYGDISAESGKKLGGIAGVSTSTINKSYSFCKISGVDYLGGIAGDGYNISGCASMCTLESDEGEYIGSIAGHVNEEAELSANYFVSDEWGGVDNINYYGRAESCAYEELMQKEEIPRGFTTVTITFKNEDEVCSTLTIPYGGSIQEEDVPKISTKDGYTKWNIEFPVRKVTENITVEAEEQRWTLSLASVQQAENGKPLFLLEGNFYESTLLTLSGCQPPENEENCAYAYSWSVENQPEDQKTSEMTAHFLIPEGADSAQVWIAGSDGKWKMTETKEDGSYLTASVPYGCSFAVYGTTESKVMYYVFGVAGVVLLMAVMIGRAGKRRRNRRKAAKEEKLVKEDKVGKEDKAAKKEKLAKEEQAIKKDKAAK